MNPPTLPEYIKLGSFVKLRDESKAEIYSIDNALPYPIHGRTLSDMKAAAWTENLYIWASAVESQQDIIGPWIDKPNCDKLWPLLPPWIKYLAMDDDSIWNGYSHKPKIGISVYHCTESGHNYCSIPKEYAPIYSGGWKDSLVERTQ
jgi:hypothetical protein